MSRTPRTDALRIKDGRYGKLSYYVDADFASKLELENADIQMSLRNWINKCAAQAIKIGDLERENAALREALASAENGLRHGLMMEPVDPFQRGKVISGALDTVCAALKKEAQP